VAASFNRVGGEAKAFALEAIVAGLTWVARSRVLGERAWELPDLGEKLGCWALSYEGHCIERLEELDRIVGLRGRINTHSRSVASNPVQRKDSSSLPGDLPRLLAGAAELIAAEGHENLTAHKIFAASGVSRRTLYANFSCVEDCVAEALHSKAEGAITEVRQARDRGLSSSGSSYRAIAALCDRVAKDDVFAKLLFGEVLPMGRTGMHLRERFMVSIGEQMGAGASSASSTEKAFFEASVGAVWGVLQNLVISGQGRQAPRVAARLAYLMLAPKVGSSVAVEAIRDELVFHRTTA
jgi:AcrR family transcriptional regulator